MSDEKDTDYMTQEELLAHIQKSDPSFKPEPIHDDKGNVINFKPLPDVSQLTPLTFTDIKADVPPPMEYVLFPCLPTQGIAFIYAASGIGKTLFTLNLAYAIAGGGNFLKYSCPKPRRVLYVDAEMAYTTVHGRLIQISKAQGELDFEENLMLLTPDKIFPARIPPIDSEYGQNAYTEIIKKFNIEVVVFDNLAMLSSLDENKSHEWKPIQDWLLYLRSMGKTIFIVHHAGKDKNGYRGTSRMLDCVNTAISLQPVVEDGIGDEYVPGKKFKIVYQKARDFGGKDVLPFEVTLDNGFWNYRSMEQSEFDKVVERANLKMTQRDIAKEIDIPLSKVNRLIKKARGMGLIRE